MLLLIKHTGLTIKQPINYWPISVADQGFLKGGFSFWQKFELKTRKKRS